MQLLQPKVLDSNALVSEMCSLLRRLVREDIAFTFQAGESLGRVKADPRQIEQVIVNLTVHSCDALPEESTATVQPQHLHSHKSRLHPRPPTHPVVSCR